MERTVLHIVGGESRSRAEQARIAFALGHHAEVYGGTDELLSHPPSAGIVLAAETGSPGAVRKLIKQLGDGGIWLPVAVTSPGVDLERVVEAIKGGALDYLALPLEPGTFARRLHDILREAVPYEERRRREVEALRHIGRLSRRERQVLELLSAGLSNKEIARRLEISSRTVEIHRSNMMTKLGATHAADAVRAWLAAGGDSPSAGHPDRETRPRFAVTRVSDARSVEAVPRVQRRG